MCGIAGIVTPRSREPTLAEIQRMTRTLHRRGPDDEGYLVDPDGGCALGHRRLSIIDLGGGQQPLATSGGGLYAVVNGEIYNYQEVRATLSSEGHHFRTGSDSESVVHAYARWGLDLFRHLDGMFAAAVWDVSNRRLVLGRGRMGKKPLYYGFVGPRRDTLVFASELKALIQHPLMERRLESRALAAYMAFDCVPEDLAIFEGVSKVQPGEAIVFDREAQRLNRHSYWQFGFDGGSSMPDTTGWTEQEYGQELWSRIVQATKARLMSDVPLGVFLSGGLDSSAIVAAMAELVPSSEIKTLSITFADRSFDEGPFARKVAAHLGTDHVEEELSDRALLDCVPHLSDFLCEPLADPSLVPTYVLSRLTRKHVTVALGGDGGDELFSGYPTFQADILASGLDHLLPPSVQAAMGRGLRRAAGLLPVSHRNLSLDFKLKRFSLGLGHPRKFRHQAWLGAFGPAEIGNFLVPERARQAAQHNPYATLSALWDIPGARTDLDRVLYQYWRLYLIGRVLVKVDRASMANGLEVRAPLLDTRVVEFAAALPDAMKIRRFTTKYLLKSVLRERLPPGIADRPKKGFGIPIGAWLKGPLRGWCESLLAADRLTAGGVFDATAVRTLFDEHVAGTEDHRMKLWSVLIFQLWSERFGPAAPLEAVDDAPARSVIRVPRGPCAPV